MHCCELVFPKIRAPPIIQVMDDQASGSTMLRNPQIDVNKNLQCRFFLVFRAECILRVWGFVQPRLTSIFPEGLQPCAAHASKKHGQLGLILPRGWTMPFSVIVQNLLPSGNQALENSPFIDDDLTKAFISRGFPS